MKNNIIRGWHFLHAHGKLANGDGRVVEVGKTYFVDAPIIICQRGLHWSNRLIDAIGYAPGPILCRIESVKGHEIIGQPDKCVSTARKVVAMADATDLLWELSRKWAASVFWKHFRHEDYPAVVAWLDRGDLTAKSAARSAAKSAAWSAAKSAAWSAAESAAWSAAESAAWSAAWSAAKSAAWSAAESAAWSAAKSAAESAAWSAAREQFNLEAEEMAKILLGGVA